MKTDKSQSREDYTDKFLDAQKKIQDLLSRTPLGIQNWSIQKTINFKKQIKKCEPLLKLKPASKHQDFVKMDNALSQLEIYYK